MSLCFFISKKETEGEFYEEIHKIGLRPSAGRADGCRHDALRGICHGHRHRPCGGDRRAYRAGDSFIGGTD